MYCKNCGKEIDDGSIFCKFCGTDLSGLENRTDSVNKNKCNVNIQLDGKVNHSIESKQIPAITTFLHKNAGLVCAYLIWLILNIVFLAAGEDESGFWPYIKHDYFSWDLDRYGLTEFFVYVLLIPFAALCIYKGLIKLSDLKNPDKSAENKGSALFVVIMLLILAALTYWSEASSSY